MADEQNILTDWNAEKGQEIRRKEGHEEKEKEKRREENVDR